MATLRGIYELRKQPVLIHACVGACMKAAEAIRNESALTNNHLNRVKWADSNPDSNADQIMPIIAMNSTIQTKWDERKALGQAEETWYDDGDIEFVVNSNIDRFATG